MPDVEVFKVVICILGWNKGIGSSGLAGKQYTELTLVYAGLSGGCH